MTKSNRTLLWILIFVLFLVIAYFAYSALSKNYEPQVTQSPETSSQPEQIQAPDFTVYDAEGNAVKLSDFTGKPIVLNFWASWCGPCKIEMPDFNEVYADVKDDVVFLMVDLVDGQRETQASGQQYIDEQGFTFPVYFDLDREGAYTYGISSIPSTLFIDSEGYVVKGYRGVLSKETLISEIESLTE